MAQELEGVMAKRLGTTYRPGARSKDWRKVKNRIPAEVVIGGYTPGGGQPLVEVRGPARRPATSTACWRSPAASAPGSPSGGWTSMMARLRALRTDECPFDPPPPTAYRRGATWVEPVLRATIEVTEFTNDGYVRQASFIDLVDD